MTSMHNIFKARIFAFFLTLFFFGTPLTSSSLYAENIYHLDPNSSQIEFTAVGKPGFLRINGKGARIVGHAKVEKKQIAGTFTTKLDDFVTGIEARDQHMREVYLQTNKFPNAKLDLNMELVEIHKDRQEFPFTATLNLHGVPKPIEGQAILTVAKDRSKVDGEVQFQIKLSDFNIAIPKYLGITVAEDVTVKATFTAITTSPVAGSGCDPSLMH